MKITISRSSKSLNQNNDANSYYNNRDFNRSKYLNGPRQNKNFLCLGANQSSRLGSSININGSIIQKNFNIEEQLEQYKLHPYRRINLKMLGEGIKQKLFEMEEEKIFEKEKTLSSREVYSNQITKMQEKYNIESKTNNGEDKRKIIKSSITDESNDKKAIKSIIMDRKPNYEFFQKETDILLNFEKNKSCGEIVKLPTNDTEIKTDSNNKNNLDKQEIKNKNSGKISKKKIKENNLNKILEEKYRQLKKIKLVYDSMDDNESDEDLNEGNVLDPEKNFILFFDLFIIIFYLYTFLFITLDLAKTKCFCPIEKKNTFNDIIFYINDLLYIFDLIISFFRGYYNFQFKLIKDNALVIENYLKGDFYLDLLEAIPIFSINKYICLYKINETICYMYEMPSLYIGLKMASFLKLLKIIKILGTKKNQALDYFFELISENYSFERVTELIINSLVFSGIIHCFVCFHIFIGKHSYSNWLVLTNSEKDSLIIIYIESLYFLVTTLTTVGYGDITCKSFEERIFHIILLAVGSIFYSYIISTIGNLIKVDSHAKIKYNNDKNILESIRVSYPNMPFKLYKNINKYLESKTNSQEKYDVNSLIETLPFTLKNTILFTMYQSVIKNFKFFKKNDNSEFIAEILNNFIPVVSKRNEFLVYEGEIIEEIIFVKDGRISMNAAIYLEDPLISINKYFNEKFNPFSLDEEKKLYDAHSNDININTGYVSTMNASITYDTAKNKINNAFKTIKNEQNLNDKSVFQLNKHEEKMDSNELIKFDINGGVIKNEDGSYQYLKILDIRKNEHFGCVFMTLKKPCPLTLQVKSKFAELYLLKKDEAVTISRNYSNIWKKVYVKEFHNLRSIKNLTFTALRKYIEINQMLFNLNLDDIIKVNDITVNDLNILEKSIIAEKSVGLYQASKKNINLKRPSTNSMKVMRYKTMNSDNIEKKRNRLSLGIINAHNRDNKILKKRIIKGKHSNSIICNSISKEKILKLVESLGDSSSKRNKPKVVHFLDDVKLNKSIKNDNLLKEKPLMKRILSSNDKHITFENDGDKSSIKKKNLSKEFKLKKLKNILINFQKKIKIIKYNISEYHSKKSILKKKNSVESSFSKKRTTKDRKPYKITIIKENHRQLLSNCKTKNSDSERNSHNDSYSNRNSLGIANLNDSLIKDLKNFCEEEEDFSFCSLKEEKSFNMNELSESKNIEIKILSSYANLNEITEGKYLDDIFLQNEIKTKLKKHYMINNNDDSLSLKSIDFSSPVDDKAIQKLHLRHNLKKSNGEPKISTNIEISPKHNKKKSNKTMSKKLKAKFSSNSSKIHKMLEVGEENKKKITSSNNPAYDTDIKNQKFEISSSIENKSSFKKKKKNEDINISTNNKNTSLFPTFKKSDRTNERNNINIHNCDNKSLSFNQNNINGQKLKNDSLSMSFKDNKQTYGLNEVEFEINNSPNNKNYNNNIIINSENKNNEINNAVINYNNIFKEKNHKKKSGHRKGKWKNNTKIINQIFPYNNIITNNITTISSNNIDNKDIFNTNSKINNIETSLSINNQMQNNLNKEPNTENNQEKSSENYFNKYFCFIY